MVKKLVISGVFVFLFTGHSWAGEYLNCLLVNKSSDGGQLKILTNSELENGLCMVLKQAVEAIGKGNSVLQGICVRATMQLMVEFRNRFPGRDFKDTLGKC